MLSDQHWCFADNGYNNYGRKLKQGNFVANIVCDALGSCDDGRGNRYYDQNRDDRRCDNVRKMRRHLYSEPCELL